MTLCHSICTDDLTQETIWTRDLSVTMQQNVSVTFNIRHPSEGSTHRRANCSRRDSRWPSPGYFSPFLSGCVTCGGPETADLALCKLSLSPGHLSMLMIHKPQKGKQLN